MPTEQVLAGAGFVERSRSMFSSEALMTDYTILPDNLPVPPHMYLSDTKLLIGEDSKKA